MLKERDRDEMGREREREGGGARERELTQINLAESYMCVHCTSFSTLL